MIRRLTIRLGSLFKRQRRELDTELRYHIDMLVEQNQRRRRVPPEPSQSARR